MSNLDIELKQARHISDPWIRSRELGDVAYEVPDGRVEQIVKEIVRSAHECKDPYRKVAGCGGALDVLIQRGHIRSALNLLASTIDLAGSIENLVNRSDALMTILRPMTRLGIKECRPLISQIAWCAGQNSGWHCARNLVDAIRLIARTDATYARQLTTSMREEQWKRKALRAIEPIVERKSAVK